MHKSYKLKGEYELIHNPGDDIKRIVYWMNDKEPHIAPYLRPALALLAACFAIESYINMVGQHVDSEWVKFDKGPTPLKEKLRRIYQKKKKHLELSRGIWQEVLDLFKIRVELVHPIYKNVKEIRTNDIPDIFQIVNSKYPSAKSKYILETAIDNLLSDTKLQHLKDIGKTEGYSGPVRTHIK